MWKRLRSNWIALASSLILLGAIAFIVRRQHGLDAVLDVWQQTDFGPLGLAVVVMLAVQAMSAWRVQTIMRADKMDAAFLPVMRIQFISLFVAHGAPISAMADVAKAVMVKLRFGVTSGHSIRVVFYERVCGALGTVIVGVFTVAWQLTLSPPPVLLLPQLLLWAGGLVIVGGLMAIGGLHLKSGIALVDRVALVVTGLGKLLRHPATSGTLLLISFVQLLCFAGIFLVLADGMHIAVSKLDVLLFMPFIFFVSSLPIFYQGWGAREAAVLATLGNGGTITSAEAIALSVGFGVTMFIASFPGAVFWMLRPSMRKAVMQEAENV